MKTLKKNGSYLTHGLTFSKNFNDAKVYTANEENLKKIMSKYLIFTCENVTTREETVIYPDVNYFQSFIKNIKKVLKKNTKDYMEGYCGSFAIVVGQILRDSLSDVDSKMDDISLNVDIVKLNYFTKQGGEHYVVRVYDFHTGLEIFIDAENVYEADELDQYVKEYIEVDDFEDFMEKWFEYDNTYLTKASDILACIRKSKI